LLQVGKLYFDKKNDNMCKLKNDIYEFNLLEKEHDALEKNNTYLTPFMIAESFDDPDDCTFV